ncbi:MAG TPA: AarF/UbiB family protein [Solirubrobacteraceae bacterium]|nr:AarF/UbiB family protein [Solirubrobacteraceae bacterium]
MPPRLPPAVRALFETAGALVRRSSSGRVAIARAAGVVPAAALPRAFAGLPDELEAAYAGATEPVPAKRVERALRDAWGRPPGRVLDRFDAEPLAVTPSAQVHAGELDGEPVAVKALRPGLAAAVRSDLALLDALAAPLGAAFPRLDVGAVLRELREAALDELDLEHEATAQRQAARLLRRVDGVVVPAVHGELAADEVMVSERLAGPTLAEAAPEDAGAVARALVAAHLVAWRDGGTILTDPRPSHVVLLGGGAIGLLGTGVSRPGDRDRRLRAVDALVALGERDPSAFEAAVAERLALLPAPAARTAHALLRDVLRELVTGPARLDEPALAAVGERALARLEDGLALAAQVTPQPSDLAVARMLGQLVALLSRLGATEDWIALLRDA